jgi:type 2 lantibiotic biosynthesis protein LanM
MAGAAPAQLNDVLGQIVGRSAFPRERLAAPPDGPEADAWIDLLADALTAPLPATPARYRIDGAPAAFEDLLAPFVEAARQRLRREAGEAFTLLSEAAQVTLERSLLLLLSRFSLAVFDTEFALHRNLAGRFPWATGSRSSHDYRRFAADMGGAGLAETMREYAVLARLLASWACRWADAHAQLAGRLRSDWPEIAHTFALGDAPCRIDGIAPYRSDPHDGGQAVSIIELPGGRRLVYKPRPVDMEQGLGELLAWANGRGFSQPYRPVRLLAREGYGWMDHVAPAPCREMAEVDAFYVRIGGLLQLLTLLQGSDFHHENLIASGDQPVVVDAETLFHPWLPPEVVHDLGPGARRDAGHDDFAGRLAESGFLPPRQGLDFSALGATGPVDTPFRIARCDAANSDAMAVRYETYRAPRGDNVPLLDGRPETAAAHRDAIIAGFGEMSRLVLRDRASLLAVIGRFAGRRGRVVVRSTNAYGLLLHASQRPDLLRDGAARSALFERLRSVAAGRAARPACWPLLDAELRALERMDVPRLAHRCDRADACWPCPLEQAVARIAQATPASAEADRAHLEQALSRLTPMPAPDGRAHRATQHLSTSHGGRA